MCMITRNVTYASSLSLDLLLQIRAKVGNVRVCYVVLLLLLHLLLLGCSEE